VLGALLTVALIYVSVARLIGAKGSTDEYDAVPRAEGSATVQQNEALPAEQTPDGGDRSERKPAPGLAAVRRAPPHTDWAVRLALGVVVGVAIISAGVFGAVRLSGLDAPAATPTPNIYNEGVALGGVAAPRFSLHDQHGNTVTLDQFKGHPVVLTFFDSLCPHFDCSLMAEYINWTAQDLGADSSKVAWVALSVNPWHDTPATATSFLSTRQVTIPLHYLLGSVDQMQPLWDAYHMQAILQNDGVVIHSTGVYVIDASGREQLYLDEGFDPKALAGYLHTMLKNGSAPVAESPGAGSIAGATLLTHQVNGYWVIFAAQPGQYGTYDFTVTLEDSQHTPVQGAHVALDLNMTSMVMSPVHVDLSPVQQGTPGSYGAPGVVSMLGPWKAEATISMPGIALPLTTSFDFTAKF
jgi:cytochrome oxidase Cu insertion factor (SCO1/SenC/PrrC family)